MGLSRVYQGWVRGAAPTGPQLLVGEETLQARGAQSHIAQDRGKPLLKASVLLKSSLVAAEATYEFTLSLLNVSL